MDYDNSVHNVKTRLRGVRAFEWKEKLSDYAWDANKSEFYCEVPNEWLSEMISSGAISH